MLSYIVYKNKGACMPNVRFPLLQTYFSKKFHDVCLILTILKSFEYDLTAQFCSIYMLKSKKNSFRLQSARMTEIGILSPYSEHCALEKFPTPKEKKRQKKR